DFLGHALQPGGTHLTRGADGEAVAGDQECLAAMDALAEVGHQIAERSGLPALVERVEALGYAVGGRRNLIGVDGVELFPAAENLQVPEDERLAADDRVGADGIAGCGTRDRVARGAWLDARRLNPLHVLILL